MTGQVSAVDDVIVALLATLRAALTVPVYDGLEPTSAADTEFVLVGHDGGSPEDGEGPSAEVTQEWMTFEAGSRQEQGAITCAVTSQSGDTDMPARRAASKTVMAAVEAALRPSENLGGAVAAGAITAVALYQSYAGGSVARRVFTYSYTAYQG